jgi:hypothetical protein
VLIGSAQQVVGGLELFGVPPVLMCLPFACGQSFTHPAQQRREGAHLGLGRHHLGSHAPAPSATAVRPSTPGDDRDSIWHFLFTHNGTVFELVCSAGSLSHRRW